jgi:photosystem II stability/assembly factor-like uncharacterized protein
MSWQPVFAGAAALTLQAHPTESVPLVAVTATGLLLHSDDGQQWHAHPTALPTPIETPPLLVSTPAALLLTVGSRIYRSGDQGGTWEEQGTLPAPVAGLTVAPEQPDRLYALAGGQLYHADAGSPWTAADPAPALHLTGQPVVLVGRPATVLAAGSDPAGAPVLAHSGDDGATWQAAHLPSDLTGAISVLVATEHRDQAWAGSSAGDLLYSHDRGHSWQRIKQGLPPVQSLAAVRLR